MPKGTRVSRCIEKLKKSGQADKYNPYAVCQASTKQSYATGKPLKKKKGKKKMKAKTEALCDFINSLKNPKTEAFIENVIMKGFKVCFEDLDSSQMASTISDLDPSQLDELKTSIEKVKQQKEQNKAEKEAKATETTQELEKKAEEINAPPQP
jgi:hypothetical protein